MRTLILGLIILMAGIVAAAASTAQFECGKDKTVIIRTVIFANKHDQHGTETFKDKNGRSMPANLFKWKGEGDTLYFRRQRCLGPF
jgi:hypothetical protein